MSESGQPDGEIFHLKRGNLLLHIVGGEGGGALARKFDPVLRIFFLHTSWPIKKFFDFPNVTLSSALGTTMNREGSRPFFTGLKLPLVYPALSRESGLKSAIICGSNPQFRTGMLKIATHVEPTDQLR
jgi:hypothetical protein